MLLEGGVTEYGTGDTGGFFSKMAIDPFTAAAIGGGIGKAVQGATGGVPTSSDARSAATGGTAYSGGNYFGSPFVFNSGGEGVAGGYGYAGLPNFQGYESAGNDPNQTRLILLALGAIVLIWLLRKK